jgi:hypothetical protein
MVTAGSVPTVSSANHSCGITMSIASERDRIIWALTNDLSELTTRDRVFLADFFDNNREMDMPKNSWITMMVEYDYHQKDSPEWQDQLTRM